MAFVNQRLRHSKAWPPERLVGNVPSDSTATTPAVSIILAVTGRVSVLLRQGLYKIVQDISQSGFCERLLG
jgi:hypothetical protein